MFADGGEGEGGAGGKVSDRRQEGPRHKLRILSSIILFHEQQHLALYLTLTVNNNITNPLYYTIIYTYDMLDPKLVLVNTTNNKWYNFLSTCNLESTIFNFCAAEGN